LTQNNPLKMKNVYATILRKHTVTKQQINKNIHANAENKAKRLNSIKATVK